jgi:hypothetical protein
MSEIGLYEAMSTLRAVRHLNADTRTGCAPFTRRIDFAQPAGISRRLGDPRAGSSACDVQKPNPIPGPKPKPNGSIIFISICCCAS